MSLRLQLIILIALFITFRVDCQSHSLLVSTGYSYQPYQFSNGQGYNISLGYERAFNSRKVKVGAKLFLSNTYSASPFDYTADRIEISVGGANYIDYPNGADSEWLFPLEESTYKALQERGYLNHYKPMECFFHDFVLDVYAAFPYAQRGSFRFLFNTGLGIGLSNTAETLGSYEGGYNLPGKPNAVWVLSKTQRLTKHLWWNLNLTNRIEYQLSEHYSIFSAQSYHVSPKLLISDPFTRSLYMVDIGLKVRMP